MLLTYFVTSTGAKITFLQGNVQISMGDLVKKAKDSFDYYKKFSSSSITKKSRLKEIRQVNCSESTFEKPAVSTLITNL